MSFLYVSFTPLPINILEQQPQIITGSSKTPRGILGSHCRLSLPFMAHPKSERGPTAVLLTYL